MRVSRERKMYLYRVTSHLKGQTKRERSLKRIRDGPFQDGGLQRLTKAKVRFLSYQNN